MVLVGTSNLSKYFCSDGNVICSIFRSSWPGGEGEGAGGEGEEAEGDAGGGPEEEAGGAEAARESELSLS